MVWEYPVFGLGAVDDDGGDEVVDRGVYVRRPRGIEAISVAPWKARPALRRIGRNAEENMRVMMGGGEGGDRRKMGGRW